MPAGKGMTDEQKCNRYPLFMRHLSHYEAHWAFWGLFALVLLLMSTTSISYGRSHECETLECKIRCRKSLKAKSKDGSYLSQEQRAAAENNRRISCRNWCLCSSLLFASMGTIAMIFGALAGLNLTFCHGEVLMVFLWGQWGVLQVGSVLAMWGVVLHQLRMRISPEIKPPWNIALGTPVLVIAGLAHWGYEELMARRRKDEDEEDEDEDDLFEPLETPDIGMHLMYTRKPFGTLPPGATLTHLRNGSWKVFMPHVSTEIWRSQQREKEAVSMSVVEEQGGVTFSRAVTFSRVEDDGGSPASLPRAVVRIRSV